MSNHELFAKLSKNFEYIEDKIKEQETKITQNNTAMNNRIDLIDEKVSKKERQDQEKISELEQRIAILEEDKKKRETEELKRLQEKEKEKTNSDNSNLERQNRQVPPNLNPRQNGQPEIGPFSAISAQLVVY